MPDTSVIDHAATQNDHWLFIAVLILLMAFVVATFRCMINDRENVAKRLTEMTDRHITVTEKLSEVVATNTAVLHEVRKRL